MNIQKVFGLLALLMIAVVGCGKRDTSSGSSDGGLSAVLGQVGRALSSTGSDTVALKNRQVALGGPSILVTSSSSQTIAVSLDCPGGGSFALSGTNSYVADTSLNGVTIAANMTLSQVFTDCQVPESDGGMSKVGGTINITNATTNLVIEGVTVVGTFVAPISGSFTISGGDSCTIEGTSTQQMSQTATSSVSTVTWSGTACGETSEQTITIIDGVPQE